MRKNILPIGLLFLSVNSFAQTIPSSSENYIYAKTCLDAACVKKSETIQYFDGLGRSKQVLNVKTSPLGNDVVTKIEYDGFGRQTKDYLPVPQQGTSNGAIYGNPLSGLPSTPYGNEKIYSEKVLENSPLDRIQQQVQVGNDWNNKPINFAYGTNTATEVKQFITTTSWTNNATNSTLTQSGNFGASQLYKNTVTDEDGNVSIEFKNGEGQTLLVRKNDGTIDSDTYYIYNEFNQLAFVIQPEASAKASLSQSDLDELCFQYRYDGRNRLVEKKLPGKGWEYLVYDRADRLILTQDPNMRTSGKWMIVKYDQFGRPIYSGLMQGGTRDSMQNQAGNLIITESKDATGFTKNGITIYYTYGYFGAPDNVLSVNYYDSYPAGTPTIPTSILSQGVLPQTGSISTKSLPTASYVNNVDADGWTKNYIWYDSKGRTIGTHSINHLGGYTKTESFIDFSGVPQNTNTYHKRRNADAELVVQEEFEYDPQNRLLIHTHEVVGKTLKELLVENHYNEIGQLEWKKVGGILGSPLQKVDYSYNIRGWMTGINSADISQTTNPDNEYSTLLNGKLFGYNIRYNDPKNASLAPGKYNGNIAEVDWIYKDTSMQRYGYQYDGLNRLLKGNYQSPDLTLPESHINDEALTYDRNGNIKTLVRNGKHGKYYTPIVVDNLGYQYTGNRVTNITDASGNSSGYEGGGQTITYDANGNTTAMPDKKISAIAYNFLNLPKQINQNTNVTNYYYRADGIKVRKRFILTNSLGTKVINTEYLDGFQYSTPNTDPIRKALENPDDATMEASFAGEEEAFTKDETRKIAIVADPGNPEVDPVMILSFFPTAEGYYDFENLRYIYQYKDHLGNVRLSYVQNGTELKIMDRNDYYPFGMSFLKNNNLPTQYDPMAIPYNYKYNGKELQETGMYDYGARFYMPDIGRWSVVDPLAEKSTRFSPYAYAFNNPIRYIDPDGRENKDWVQQGNRIFFDSGVKSTEDAKRIYGDNAVRLNESTTVNGKNSQTGEIISSYALNTDGTITDNSTGTVFEDGNNPSVLGGGGLTLESGDKKDTSWNFYVDFDASLDIGPQLRGEGKFLGVALGVDLQKGTISGDDIMNPGNPNMVVKDVTGGKIGVSGFTKTVEKVNGKVVNTTVESNAIIGNFKRDNNYTYFNESVGAGGGFLFIGGSISFEIGVKKRN